MSVETPACRRFPASEARHHAQANHCGNLNKAQEAVFSSPPAAEDNARACRTVHIQSDTTTVQGIACAHVPGVGRVRQSAAVPAATPQGMPREAAEHPGTRPLVFTLFAGRVTPPAGLDS